MRRLVLLAFVWIMAQPGLAALTAPEIKRLESAAGAGDREAAFQLAMAYMASPETYASARPWYQRAAELGHAEAMFYVAIDYQHAPGGGGIEWNIPKSLEWLRKGASAGSARAMINLADLLFGRCQAYEDPADPHKILDDEEAITWYKKAGDLGGDGSEYACSVVAQAYLEGKGVPRNPKRAIEWLEKGTVVAKGSNKDQGIASGNMMALAELYLKGEVVGKDPAKGEQWLLRAAETNDLYAMMGLADRYMKGDGVKKDLMAAQRLFEAVKAKHPDVNIEKSVQELAATQVAEKRFQQLGAKAGKDAPVMPMGWFARHLLPPPGYESLEAVDVFFSAPYRRVLQFKKGNGWPTPKPDEIDWDWMYLLPGNNYDEARQNKIKTSGNDFMYEGLTVRGSDMIGAITLGWVAYVHVADWTPRPGWPTSGAGMAYGAASFDEALEVAYRSALQAYRNVSSGPVRRVTCIVGVSARPNFDLYYKSNNGGTGLYPLAYLGIFQTPAFEDEARGYGLVPTFPSDPAQFPRFVRSMPQRNYQYRTADGRLFKNWFGLSEIGNRLVDRPGGRAVIDDLVFRIVPLKNSLNSP